MRADPTAFDETAPIFSIAAAAELAGMHPQTLRQYDRLGLVVPTRTRGNIRRYSLRDVSELREIARLVADGLNLEGISRVLDLQAQLRTLEQRVRSLEHEVAQARLSRARGRVFAADADGDVVKLARGVRARRPTDLVRVRPVGARRAGDAPGNDGSGAGARERER